MYNFKKLKQLQGQLSPNKKRFDFYLLQSLTSEEHSASVLLAFLPTYSIIVFLYMRNQKCVDIRSTKIVLLLLFTRLGYSLAVNKNAVF